MTNSKNEVGNLQPVKEFTFNPNNAPIRVQMINQEPWFVAKDVCEVLTIENNRDAVNSLDDDEKLTSAIPTSGQNRQMWLVNESGLYHLIFQSRKPEAKAFRKWVTSEVLPGIRKTGSYSIKPFSDPRAGDYLDLRDMPYESQLIENYPVRFVIYDDVAYYSVNDIFRAIQASTSSNQCVQQLNSKKPLARKIFIFGNTHPAWFTTYTGLRLIIAGSRKLKTERHHSLIAEKGGAE